MEEPSQPLQAAVVQFAHLDIEREVIDEARIAAAREERRQWEEEALAAAGGDQPLPLIRRIGYRRQVVGSDERRRA